AHGTGHRCAADGVEQPTPASRPHRHEQSAQSQLNPRWESIEDLREHWPPRAERGPHIAVHEALTNFARGREWKHRFAGSRYDLSDTALAVTSRTVCSESQ